eukprot:scaffold109086_cov53-Attheya_sp.AAC.1
METLGRKTGYLFVNMKTERRVECSQDKKRIFDKLREIQVSNPELIEPECGENQTSEDVAHSKGEGKAVANDWRVEIDTLDDFGTNLEA